MTKRVGRSVFGCWWLDFGIGEVNVARGFFSLAVGGFGRNLWFMIGRDPSDRVDLRRHPRFTWVSVSA